MKITSVWPPHRRDLAALALLALFACARAPKAPATGPLACHRTQWEHAQELLETRGDANKGELTTAEVSATFQARRGLFRPCYPLLEAPASEHELVLLSRLRLKAQPTHASWKRRSRTIDISTA